MKLNISLFALLLTAGCVTKPVLLNCQEICAFDNMKCVGASISNVPDASEVYVPIQNRIFRKDYQCAVDDSKLAEYESLRNQVIEKERKRLSPEIKKTTEPVERL